MLNVISMFRAKLNKYFNTYFILKIFSKKGLVLKSSLTQAFLFSFIPSRVQEACWDQEELQDLLGNLYVFLGAIWVLSGKLAAKYSIGLLCRVEYGI